LRPANGKIGLGPLQLDLNVWQATGGPAGQLQRLVRGAGAGRANGSNAAVQFLNWPTADVCAHRGSATLPTMETLLL